MNENCKKYQWKCTVCGNIYDGDPLPDHYTCPVCGAPKPKFEKEEKVHESKKTDK